MRWIIILSILLTACSTTQKLPTGSWSGYVSPMDFPNSRIILNYKVYDLGESVGLQIFSPGGTEIQTKNIQMTKDSLFFSYDKQKQQGEFSCGLEKVNKHYYYGRCTDSDGKWALFTMKHNLLNEVGVDPHSDGVFGCPCHN